MKKNKFIFYLFAILSSFCLVCIVAVIAIESEPDITPSQPPQTQMPIEQIIAGTYQAAQEQTKAAQSPTPLDILIPTSTLPPASIPIEPTSTIFIFELQTQVAQPTAYTYQTNTPFVLATQPASSGDAVCSCTGDTLNCSDFQTHSQAQACFNYCISQGAGDIHRLDANNDGSACESLP